jgi:hypothetical protein
MARTKAEDPLDEKPQGHPIRLRATATVTASPAGSSREGLIPFGAEQTGDGTIQISQEPTASAVRRG